MNILHYFSRLYNEKRELALLEWAYLVIVIAGVVIAGILALFSQPLGLAVLIVPFVAFIAASMNVVAWALIKLVGDAVAKKPTPRTKRK